MSLALLEGREQLWQQRECSHLLSDTVTGICVANPALNFYFFNETLLPPFQPSLKSITPISISLWMLINSYTILLTVNVDF